MIAADSVLGNNRNGLVRAIIDHDQTLDRPSGCDSIEDEIHRPNLVRGSRTDQGLAFRHRDLLATPTTNMQQLESVEPLHALIVHKFTRLPKLEMNHPDAVTAMTLRQGNDTRPQLDVAVGPRLIP